MNWQSLQRPISRAAGDSRDGQSYEPGKNDCIDHWVISFARGETDAEKRADRNVRGRDRQTVKTRSNDKDGRREVRSETLTVIHGGDFFAHRLGDFSGVEQTTSRHNGRDGREAPANVECLPQEEQRHDLRRVVQSTGE